MFGALRKPTTNVSLKGRSRVRGYEISRMPIGAYIEALELIQRLPGELLAECFPGMSIQQIGVLMQKNSREAMELFITSMLDKAPRYLLDVASSLLGIDRTALETDGNIGLDGLMEMIEAWVEINGLANFTKAVKRLIKRMGIAARQDTPSEASSD